LAISKSKKRSILTDEVTRKNRFSMKIQLNMLLLN
jgi:hypothetical protein